LRSLHSHFTLGAKRSRDPHHTFVHFGSLEHNSGAEW